MVWHQAPVPLWPSLDVLTLSACSFNCNLPIYSCGQFAPCSEYSGKCDCPPGFGGDNCLEPRTQPPFEPNISSQLILIFSMLQNAGPLPVAQTAR